MRNLVDDLFEQIDVHGMLFPLGNRDRTKIALEIAYIAELYMQHAEFRKNNRLFRHYHISLCREKRIISRLGTNPYWIYSSLAQSGALAHRHASANNGVSAAISNTSLQTFGTPMI